MFAALKRLFSHVLVYGAGNVVARAVTFLLAPLLTNFIDPVEYGKLGLVQTFIGIAQVFLICGMGPAIIRYSIREKYEIQSVFSAGTFWVAVFSLSGLAVLALAGPYFSKVLEIGTGRIYLYALAILCLDALAAPPYAYLQAVQKPHFYALLKIVQVLVHFGGTFYLVALRGERSIEGVLLANAAASLLQFVLFLPLFAKNLRFKASPALLKKMLRFGLPYIPNVVFVVVIELMDRVILAKLTDIHTVGLYSAAVKIAMVMFLIVFAFQTAWQPFFLSQANTPGGERLFARIMTYYLLCSCGVFLAVSLFYPEIANIGAGRFTLVGKPYQEGLRVVPWILLAYLTLGVYVNLSAAFHLKEKTKYFPLFSLAGAVVNVSANFALIPRFGMMGSAFATFLSFFIMTVMAFPAARRLYAVPYEWGRAAKILAAGAAAFAAGAGRDGIWARCLAAALFPAGLLAGRFFYSEEFRRIKNLLRRA